MPATRRGSAGRGQRPGGNGPAARCRQEFARIRGVFEKQAGAQADMDRATTARKQARANEDAATAALQQARQELAYTEVKAPYNGIVIERHDRGR